MESDPIVYDATFFLWGNSSTSQLMARDPEVNTFSKWMIQPG